MSTAYLLTTALAFGCAFASPVERRQVASVISSCTVPGTIALTFDDGPFTYTESLLNQLSASGINATFFLNGINWGSIYDYQSTVKRMINEGHQIGSHTWSHADLITLDTAGVTSQMVDLETALLTIIGKFPTYMRPPYFSYDTETLNVLGSLGYKVIHADIDTLDWEYNTPEESSQSAAIFEAGVSSGGSISLSHDVHPVTVDLLVPAMIQIIKSRGLRAVTVGECLGDAPANWYTTSRNGGGSSQS